MAYIFRGKLCGLICPECPEPLANVVVRLYRSRDIQTVTALAVANPKETFAVLTEKQVKDKASTAIAEAKTDDGGNFTFDLGDKERYQGEAFEIDVYCATVPRLKPRPNPPAPAQFSITTLQPRWRQTETGFVAVWDYCLPHRFWCFVRALFGAWTICGRVTLCGNQATPVAGVKVRAFDADWIQQDEIGFAFTDAAGKFRIDYVTEDFQKTPWSPLINFELIGGPDLYFRVEDSGGNPLLDEPVSRGRASDRENAGNCFCVELCVDTQPTPPFNNPWFTHVGDFHIITDISAVSGLTNSAVLGHGGPNYGFFGGMKLRGFCPKTSPIGPPDPMRYRFLYATLDNPANQIPITGDKVSPALVGSRLIQWKLFDDSLVWTFQSIQVAGSGATPDPTPTPVGPGPWGPVPAHVIVPDANGWIAVDQNSLDDGFYGPLIRFNSAVAIPGGAAPGSGAGNAPASPKNGVAIRLIFEAGPITSPATFTNDLPKVVVNNWNDVMQLTLQQFLGPGATSCSELTTALNILYTADHELMAAWGLGISTAAAVPGGIPVLPSGTTPRGGFGNHFVDISTWPSCSYTVSLTARRSLTDGENDDSAHTTSVTFCK